MQKYSDFLYIFSGYLKKLFILCLILIMVYIDGAPRDGEMQWARGCRARKKLIKLAGFRFRFALCLVA